MGPPWQASLGRTHPLAGRIWDVADARFLGPTAFVRGLAGARFVLLGEKHDNPDHHRLQTWVLQGLIREGRRPAVAFEMLTAADAPVLMRHLATAPRDAAGLGDAVNWRQSGWPDWQFYQPIAQAALDAGLPILAANIPLPVARALTRGDRAGLDSALVHRYELDRVPADLERAMARELRDSHCGQLPDRLIPGMVAAQRARDAQMAESLVAGGQDGGVLIAGTGHVRTDRGVPAYLRRRVGPVRVASLAFLEVDDRRAAPQDYAARYEGSLPYDYVWFTPRVDDKDPCETFRQPRSTRSRPVRRETENPFGRGHGLPAGVLQQGRAEQPGAFGRPAVGPRHLFRGREVNQRPVPPPGTSRLASSQAVAGSPSWVRETQRAGHRSGKATVMRPGTARGAIVASVEAGPLRMVVADLPYARVWSAATFALASYPIERAADGVIQTGWAERPTAEGGTGVERRQERVTVRVEPFGERITRVSVSVEVRGWRDGQWFPLADTRAREHAILDLISDAKDRQP